MMFSMLQIFNVVSIFDDFAQVTNYHKIIKPTSSESTEHDAGRPVAIRFSWNGIYNNIFENRIFHKYRFITQIDMKSSQKLDFAN